MSAELLEGFELHLYVVEFADFGVKVGVTSRPDKRIAQHRRDAAAYGRTVDRVWLSDPHTEARANERALKRLAGTGQRREYLPLRFEDVVSHAEELPKSRMDRAVAQQKQESRLNFFKSILGGDW